MKVNTKVECNLFTCNIIVLIKTAKDQLSDGLCIGYRGRGMVLGCEVAHHRRTCRYQVVVAYPSFPWPPSGSFDSNTHSRNSRATCRYHWMAFLHRDPATRHPAAQCSR